jgi:uncharacterized protein with HEPN domain
MAKRSQILFIEDILDAMKKIKQYLQNVNYAQFISNDMLMDAVLRQMEIVGEAA